eukprot:TRINITY_DN2918_c0_g1_i1.p1 TRINITY_DN2918_c0_g1~~TRINITY_DN2918_c0_g1_i1.p1  ORF type:complete len:427 (+),score=103.78 TRINITY_DN2918_c0_g1_i1:41-1321(+)
MDIPEETLAHNAPTVMVSFFTTTYTKSVPESQTFSVPKTVTKNGLSNLVNKLLGNADEEAIPFDFLYNDEFVSLSLDKFLKKRPEINTDDTLSLEYTPSMSMEEGNEIPHDDWVSSVCAPFYGELDGDVVVTGCYDRRVRLCHGSEVLAVGDGHTGAVKSVAAVKNGLASMGTKRRRRNVPGFTALSGSKDGTVRVWSYDDAKGLKSVRTLKHHSASVDTVSINAAGDLGCSASWDKTVSLFRIPDCMNADITDVQIATMTGHSRPILASSFTKDNRHVFTSGLDGQLKQWDVSRAAFYTTYSGEYATYSLDVNKENQNLIVTGHSDNRARLWDIREKKVIKSFSGHTGWVYSIKWCPEEGNLGTSFVTAAEDSALNYFDVRAVRPLSTHTPHTDGILSLSFTAPTTVASASKDTKVKTTTLSPNK